MADDLVKRLREKAKNKTNSVGDKWGDWVCDEAADRIESLEAALQAADELARAMQREEDCFGLPDFMQAALAAYRRARGGEP